MLDNLVSVRKAFGDLLRGIQQAGIASRWLMILHANEDSPEWIEVPDRGHADFKAIQDKQMFLEQMQNISLCALTGLSKSEYSTMMKELGFVKEKKNQMGYCATV